MFLWTIIAGCDGSEGGRDATVLARTLAEATGAQLLLVAVDTNNLLAHVQTSDRAFRTAADLIHSERRALVPDARTLAVPGKSAPAVLQHVAHSEHASLLVLGSHRGTPAGHVRAGRAMRKLLHGAPCPVAIAPTGWRNQAPELARIGVGINDAAESYQALHFACSLAGALHGSLVVRSVVDAHLPAALDPFGTTSRVMEWDGVTEREQLLAHARVDRAVAQAGVAAVGDVVVGEPAGALVDLGRSVDALVVGSRRWGPLARLVLGSTGDAVVHRATCPVFVVPRSTVVEDDHYAVQPLRTPAVI